MKWQLRLGNGKLVLSAMLICCLWMCAVPAARAQATLSKPSISINVVSIDGGKMYNWSLKATATLTGINPQNAATTFSYSFQSSNDGGKTWSDMNYEGTQSTTAVGGTASLDTDWIGNRPGKPPKGVIYRVGVGASYKDATGKIVQITVLQSDPLNPN